MQKEKGGGGEEGTKKFDMVRKGSPYSKKAAVIEESNWNWGGADVGGSTCWTRKKEGLPRYLKEGDKSHLPLKEGKKRGAPK